MLLKQEAKVMQPILFKVSLLGGVHKLQDKIKEMRSKRDKSNQHRIHSVRLQLEEREILLEAQAEEVWCHQVEEVSEEEEEQWEEELSQDLQRNQWLSHLHHLQPSLLKVPVWVQPHPFHLSQLKTSQSLKLRNRSRPQKLNQTNR